MIGKFKKQVKTLFVDKNSTFVSVEGHVNIILSPSFYWVKKVSLPVKYLRDVKALLPSLFEDILPPKNYSYSAYKYEDEYFIFAYEDKMILDSLAEKGISASQIKAVHFAQSEFFEIDGPIEIDTEQTLFKKDDILMLLPSSWFDESQDINLNELKLSKQSITLKQFSHIVDDKTLFKISALVLIFILVIAAEYFITQEKVQDISKKQEALFSKYKLQSTMFQNKAMFKELNSKYKKQMLLRRYMATVLKLSLESKQKLVLVELKGNKLKLAFSGEKEGLERLIFKQLKVQSIHYSAKYKKNTLYVELSL